MRQAVKKLDGSLGLALEDGARIMFVIFSAFTLLILLRYEWIAIPHPYSLDYGEAPLVDHAMSMAAGENIYRADISQPPYTISNYPPLYIALVAIGVKLFGPAGSFFFGRILSALCCWLAGFFIALLVYKSTQDRFATWTASITFLAFPFVVFWSPLLRIDMLALALSLGGLCFLIWKPGSMRHFIGAGVLLVAAIYTRQSYALAAPLAAFVWLLARDWKQAFQFAALVGGSSLLLFLTFNILTEGGFFFNIVTANVNEFRMDILTYNWNRLREVAFFPLLFGAILLLLPLIAFIGNLFRRFYKPESNPEVSQETPQPAVRSWNPLWMLAAPYLVGSLLSAATIGKVGSNVNYLLELCAGLGLAAGVVIASSRVGLKSFALRGGLIILLALGVARLMHFTLSDYANDLRDRRTAIVGLNELKSLVADTPGAILADEYMGMLTLTGRPLVIQPFEVTQLARDGKWDQQPLLDSIRNKEYASIILYDQPWSLSDRWTPEMLDAVYNSYTLVDVVGGNRVYKVVERTALLSVDSCPGAFWRLPSDGSRGVQIQNGGLDFFGQGSEGKIPVYAVADGFLIRDPNWIDAVTIQHDDPLHPGTKVWTYYGGMASASGLDSFVADAFRLMSAVVPVKAGDLLGYQGSWSGQPFWGKWTHAHFAVIRAAEGGLFPDSLGTDQTLDAAGYLGIILDKNNPNIQTLGCNRP